MSAQTLQAPAPERVIGASEETVSLAIGGMTCGACAARVERALNSLEGVHARVNYAAERANVALADGVPLQRLIDKVAATGYSARTLQQDTPVHDQELERRVRALRRRLLVSATLFMPLCDTSIFFSIYPSLRFVGWQWVMIALTLPVVTWAASPFYAAALRGARHATTTMDTLVSLGILAATGWSVYAMFHLDTGTHAVALLGLAHSSRGGIYLDVPAGVTTFLLAGRYFEAWSKRRSGNALRALAALRAREVSVLEADGSERRRAIEELAVGDRFLVRAGENVAADGEVLSGYAAVDRSVMTGESQPADVGPGQDVLGGTVSLSGHLVVQAHRVGAETQLAQMMRLVENAQNEKAAVQRLADRVCAVFVPVVIVLALATLLVWLLTQSSTDAAFSASLSVLIIACPCALGLATPAALVMATWAGARLGIFFKGYGALEASHEIDTVVLDKTGTLTAATMTLVALEPAPGVQERALLRAAGAVEHASEHPIARALASEAERRYGGLPAVEDFSSLPGVGAWGSVEGQRVRVGRAFVEQLPSPLARRCAEWEALGHTVVAVHRDESTLGLLAVADEIRPSAARAIAQLKALGLHCVLVTGDNELTAKAVGEHVGIERVLSGALPSEKVDVIRALREQGHRVAMVGDGVNDAPALAAADLGLAVGSGTDIAIGAADLIIMREDLTVAASAIALARKTLRTVRGNLAWAFLYNVVAIPLAALGLLDPLIAGAAMALSSSFVVWNSSRLRSVVR